MGQLRPPRLKALLLQILLLLESSSTVKQQRQMTTGVDHHLQCVNDYLYTMNCSLNIIPSENTSISNKSYWLKIRETTDELEYECLLTNTTGGYFCSINKLDKMPDVDIFSDLEGYEISLCQSRDDGSKSCEVLDEDYNPSLNIKPNAPCCLTVSHNSSQVHFTWRSTYEEYSSSTDLVNSLQYQLLLYKTEDKNMERIYIDTGKTHSTVDTSTLVDKFVSDTEYAATVRSTPNMNHYKGQWSDWSSEVLWRTDPAVNNDLPRKTLTFELPVVFGAFCVIVVIVLVLYYSPIKMWRQSTFIPTPALYFNSLYKDYQGDFKSWVVTQNAVGVLKAEETLKIDTLVQCEDAQSDRSLPVFQQQWMEGSMYRNILAQTRDADLSTLCTDCSWLSAPQSSGNSLPAWSESGSPAGDSGCWLCSDTSLEREPPLYCNEYCTLSSIQRSSCGSAEHHGNPAQHKLSA